MGGRISQRGKDNKEYRIYERYISLTMAGEKVLQEDFTKDKSGGHNIYTK